MRRSLLLLWTPVLVVAGLLFWLSHQTALPAPPVSSDLVAHAIVYAALGLLCLRACHRGFEPPRLRATSLAVALTVAYGATDEYHQTFVPGRTASLADLAADAVGALIAVGLFALVARLRGKMAGPKGFSRT